MADLKAGEVEVEELDEIEEDYDRQTAEARRLAELRKGFGGDTMLIR